MADTIVDGGDYLLYINTGGAPGTDPDEITNYHLVGLGQNLTFSDTSNQLTSNNKANGARGTTLPGTQQYTLSGTVEWAHDTNGGQQQIWDAVKTTTSANKLMGWMITTNVTGDIQIRGEAYALSWELTLNNDEIAVASFEFGGNGDYTKETVDA